MIAGLYEPTSQAIEITFNSIVTVTYKKILMLLFLELFFDIFILRGKKIRKSNFQ